jgi:hypothetical protein
MPRYACLAVFIYQLGYTVCDCGNILEYFVDIKPKAVKKINLSSNLEKAG